MTDDALTDAKACTCGLDDRPGGENGPSPTAYSVLMDMCPKHASHPVTSLPWSTMDALTQIGYTEPSPYIYGLEDLPPIGVRRGGLRFPRVYVVYAIKRLGWRRWHVRMALPGDAGIFSLGPFTSRKRAESTQSDLRQLLQQVDYIYTYKTGV